MGSDGATAKIHHRFMVLWYKEVLFNHRIHKNVSVLDSERTQVGYVLVTFLVGLPWGEALTWGP